MFLYSPICHMALENKELKKKKNLIRIIKKVKMMTYEVNI